MDHQVGRAFNTELVRREIERLTDLQMAKQAALMLLQQIEIQRQVADLIVRWDWQGRDVA